MNVVAKCNKGEVKLKSVLGEGLLPAEMCGVLLVACQGQLNVSLARASLMFRLPELFCVHLQFIADFCYLTIGKSLQSHHHSTPNPKLIL